MFGRVSRARAAAEVLRAALRVGPAYTARVPASYRETLPVALNLNGRNVLLLGGGAEAEDKLPKLLEVGARVTLVAERTGAALDQAIRRSRVIWYARGFVPSDLVGVQLVMLTDQDAGLARRLRALQQRYAFWLCAVDQPDYSDLFLVSMVRRGPLQIGISTGGGAPLLARRIRQGLEAGLDQRLAEFARSFADLRAELRQLPKLERARKLEQALHGFAIDVQVSYPEASD
jgi:siroheme synthase-like protein